MTIHILNCLTMNPPLLRRHIGAVCLLVETDEGPVLVDTGFGLHDYSHPAWIVRSFSLITGVLRNQERTAIRQVVGRGWQTEKVRHIILTHLHFDHAGGLQDFPQAWVHVYQPEYAALRKPHGLVERLGYNKSDFSHGPKWVFHDEVNARWFGFDAIRLDFKPEMYLIPLPGHTRGNCGVAVRQGSSWLFQCAGALPINARFPAHLKWLNKPFRGPHLPRLEAFAKAHPEVQMMAGHMDLDWFEKK